jgi:chorismate mutase
VAEERDVSGPAEKGGGPADIDGWRQTEPGAPLGQATSPPDRDSLPGGRKSDDDAAQGREGSAAPPATDPDIDGWRRRIDIIDEQLMRLLNSRSACAVEIGRIKRRLGLPIYSPEREAKVLDRVMRENTGPLDPMAVRRVFERIIDEGRRLERLAAEGEIEDKPKG